MLARQMFAKAIEIDPLYARAYAGIANCDARLWLVQCADPAEEILAIADKALALDPNLAEAHAARGVALANSDRRTEAARHSNARSSSIRTVSMPACPMRASASRKANSSERSSYTPARWKSSLTIPRRRCSCRSSIVRSAGLKRPRRYSRLGLKRAEEALRLHPESSRPAQLGACALAALGEKERAMEWLERALSIDPDDNNARYNAACTYAQLGEIDRAIDVLEVWVEDVGSELGRSGSSTMRTSTQSATIPVIRHW